MSFGRYTDYRAPTSFAAISSPHVLSVMDLFLGYMDRSDIVNSTLAFDSFIEARDILIGSGKRFQLIAELIAPKEDLLSMLERGLSNCIIKCFTPEYDLIKVTPKEDLRAKESKLETEIEQLKQARFEPAVHVYEQLNT